MKVFISLLLLAVATSASAECDATKEMPLQGATKMAFTGFQPKVERFVNSGQGNKVVFKNYAAEPMVDMVDGVLTVTAGDPCSSSGGGGGAGTPTNNEDGSAATIAKTALGMALPMLAAKTAHVQAATLGVAMTVGVFGGTSLVVTAEDVTAECELAPIEVDIYLEATSDEIVMRESQSGDFETCPPESLYWKHHAEVYGGYEGCVGEVGYYPCGQDSEGIEEEDGALYAKTPINWNAASETCEKTGYSMQNRTFWILWGDPLDKYELNMRTGFNPVVSFPFNRGPYPTYALGAPLNEAIDDSSDARAGAKDLLEYLGGFTADQLTEYDVSMTEGAESGMVILWAAKALEMARTTCNRDIQIFSQVPSYGYSTEDASFLANKYASSFYNGTECMCYNASTCQEPTITITQRGWLPRTPLPVAMGGDGTNYTANSDSLASPWLESLVFPENPTGELKETQLPNADRRVCDGVYLWPMYFGMRNYSIPIDEMPNCSAWSFSITKAYSASVRAGFVIYKQTPEESHDAVVDILTDTHSMTNGLYSEWSWYGQMQLWDMIMSRPISDPTSWIGAYTEIMHEKWQYIIDGFAACPVTQVSNPYAGAYVWFVFQSPYIGIQGDFVSSFFRDVLGVRATTYNWGFRGADPADFYGEGYIPEDFTRLQLYRDRSVYAEVGRRAKIVCADMDATVGDFISVNQWVNGQGTTARRLGEGYRDIQDRKRHLLEHIPDLKERQLEYLAASHEISDKMDKEAASCAPEFTTSCLFQRVGTRFSDF